MRSVRGRGEPFRAAAAPCVCVTYPPGGFWEALCSVTMGEPQRAAEGHVLLRPRAPRAALCHVASSRPFARTRFRFPRRARGPSELNRTPSLGPEEAGPPASAARGAPDVSGR